MCKASHEPGGPQRCSGDARRALASSMGAVAQLERCRDALISTAAPHDVRPEWGRAVELRRQYLADAAAASPRVAATRFARAVLREGVAVVVDTETVSMGGPICEIAVVDAHTGRPLLNTLVNPGCPMTPAAQAVHGITESEITGPHVPSWAAVHRRFAQLVDGKVVLAYNADYDRRVVADDCRRYGVDASGSISQAHWWADVMAPRSDFEGTSRRLRNGGGHRALGDVELTRRHLLTMAAGS